MYNNFGIKQVAGVSIEVYILKVYYLIYSYNIQLQ